MNIACLDPKGLVTGYSLLVSSKVDCVNFTVLSADEISTYSEVEVLNQNNYETWLINLKDPLGGSSQISKQLATLSIRHPSCKWGHN